MRSLCCVLLVACLAVVPGINGTGARRQPQVSGDSIASVANSYINSTYWAYNAPLSSDRLSSSLIIVLNINYRWNSWMCHLFVADVLREAGASAPTRGFRNYPLEADHWANPNSRYMRHNNCWSHVTNPTNGDVIAGGGHVGIVTGPGITTSALRLRITRESSTSAFNGRTSFTYWRYVC